MALLSNEELSVIRNSVDIVDVVSHYIPLIQRGKNFMCACPFHNDNNPSMSVSREKQIYTCFSCHKTGNVFTFISEYEHMTFIEAVKKVADLGGIPVNIKSYDIKPINSPLYGIYELSSKFYQNNLYTKNGALALKYLMSRQLDATVIKEFEIGVSLRERTMLTKLLENKKYAEKDIAESGLVFKSEHGFMDMFQNRIMFPLWNLSGAVVGFSGRIYETNDVSKYINTKQTAIFKKGELLYNYHRAKEECRRQDTVIIMEGFMDLLRSHMVGIKNVIATMGTAVTSNQAKLIKRLAHKVIICFDGDDAGARATLALANQLLDIDVTAKIVRLEEKLDPDEFILKYGKDKFMERLDNAINVVDFKIGYLKQDKDLTSSQDMATYVNDVIKELTNVNDDILRELALKKLSVESGIDHDFLKSKLLPKVDKPDTMDDFKREELKLNLYEKAQLSLLYYMLKSTDVISMYNKKVTYMPTDCYRFLAREISEYSRIYGKIDVAGLMDYLSDNELMCKTLSDVMLFETKDEYTFDEIDAYIAVIQKYNVDYELKRIKKEISNEVDITKKALLGQKMCELIQIGGNKNV